MSEQITTTDPVLPEAKMHLARPNAPITGRVVSNDMCLKGKSNDWAPHTEIVAALETSRTSTGVVRGVTSA